MVYYQNIFLRCLLVSMALVTPSRSLIVSSKLFSKLHVPQGYHPETPARITSILQHLEQKYKIVEPNTTPEHKDKALSVILDVHDPNYVNAVKIRSIKFIRAAWSVAAVAFGGKPFSRGDFGPNALARFSGLAYGGGDVKPIGPDITEYSIFNAGVRDC
jgi:hypothetical protein